MSRRSLTSRPLDLFYVVFFVIHIPISLLNMGQALYPPHLIPEAIAQLPKMAVEYCGDFIAGGVMGYPGYAAPEKYSWLLTFIRLEIFFQVPVFFLGIRGLVKDSRAIYVLLLIYASSATTTIFPLLEEIYTAPLATVSLSHKQGLLASYGSFFAVCFIMTVDMARRLVNLVNEAQNAQNKIKAQ